MNPNIPDDLFSDEVPDDLFGDESVGTPVDQKISGRQDILSQLTGTARGGLETLIGSGLKLSQGDLSGLIDGVTGLQKTSVDTLLKGVGGISQRAEAAIANPLLEKQKGRTPVTGQGSVLDETLKVETEYQDRLLNSFLDGIKGKKHGEFGDLIRTTGFGGEFNEPLAGTIGLATSAALLNVPTRGELIKAANKFESAIPKKLPKFAGKDTYLNIAKQADEGLDDLRRTMGKAVDEAVEPVKDKLVNDPSIVNEALSDLPDNVRKIVVRDAKKVLKLGKDDSIPPTIGNVRLMRQLLDEYIPKKVFDGVRDASIDEKIIYGSSNKLRNSIADTSPELAAANKEFSGFMDLYGRVKRILIDGSSGEVKDTGLKNLYSLRADRGLQKQFEHFDALLPQGKKVLENLQAFNRGQRAKTVAGASIKAAAGTVALGYAASKLGPKSNQ